MPTLSTLPHEKKSDRATERHYTSIYSHVNVKPSMMTSVLFLQEDRIVTESVCSQVQIDDE